MERARLKLAVIFLLAALNIVLLGYVLLQAHQTREYEALTHQQVLTYLNNHGIAISEASIPWKIDGKKIDGKKIDLDTEGAALSGDPIPEGGLPDNCEVETSRDAVTLLMDFARGLSDTGASGVQVESIQTGYRYTDQGDRGLITPLWLLKTDAQTYCLNCATGELTGSDATTTE